jgi:hypothetical protein
LIGDVERVGAAIEHGDDAAGLLSWRLSRCRHRQLEPGDVLQPHSSRSLAG